MDASDYKREIFLNSVEVSGIVLRIEYLHILKTESNALRIFQFLEDKDFNMKGNMTENMKILDFFAIVDTRVSNYRAPPHVKIFNGAVRILEVIR